jgi:hypothetical protein
MKRKLKSKVLSLIEDLPEDKIPSVVDYIGYLMDKEAVFTPQEKAIIRKAHQEAARGKGIDWRRVRRPHV